MKKEERQKVRELIDKMGIKHKHVADRIGVHKVVFSYFLNGDRDLKPEELTKLKNYLQLRES